MFNQQSIFNCCFTHCSGGVKNPGLNPRCKMRSAPNGDPATYNRGGRISIWRSKPGSLGGRWMFFFLDGTWNVFLYGISMEKLQKP